MYFKYLIQIYLLLLINLLISSDNNVGVECRGVESLPLPSHCNYTIDSIDAITNYTNGTLFVASGDQYWLLKPYELPVHDNARLVQDLLPGGQVSQVNAAINLKIKAVRGSRKCVPVAEQLMFYTQANENNSVVVNIYEDEKWTVRRSVDEVDVLNAAKSVNWSQPIDAFGFFGGIFVIFQGNYYTSIKCELGEWQEVRHLNIPASFSGIEGPLDSANFHRTDSQMDDAYLYMFKAQNYFICPVFGNEPCNGPLSLVDDFFRFDEDCGLNPKALAANLLHWIIIAFLVAIILLVLLGFCCYGVLCKSRKITFWVNQRRAKDPNASLTYEALNGQQMDVTNKAGEPKDKTTNGNGVEMTIEDQTNTPFIDSNGKDEDINH